MGAVYEAVDQRLGITVALKETLSSDEAVRKQFEREARLLAGMQHPALPRVSDHFVEGDRAFLVMEFIAGVDLAKIVAQQPGPFPRDQVVAWADQLLDALIYLHTRERQVIHRDIKPHNLKLTASGQIALLDFGLAKDQPGDPSSTSSSAFYGYTRQYAPLEQIQDRWTDPRSDIYALGATLYHLLTGVKPPDALLRAAAILNSEVDPLKPANVLNWAVDAELASVLSKAMAQKPEDRFASASEFREVLSRLGRKTPGPTGGMPEREPRATTPTKKVAVPELNMAMVVSTRRFGPAGVTAVLGVVMILGASLLYGSHRLFQVTKAETIPTSRTQTQQTVKPSVNNVSPPATQSVERTTRQDVKEKDLRVKTSSEQKPGAEGVPEAIERTPRRATTQPEAPTIRLPNPELRENLFAPVPDAPLIRGERSSSISLGTSRHD
jgi:serine/threonine protein kinase